MQTSNSDGAGMKGRDISKPAESRATPGLASMPVSPKLDRITFEPGKMGGRACIRGLRVTVGVVVSLVAEGVSWEAILTDYPYLEGEDIRQALAYAAWLTREEVLPA